MASVTLLIVLLLALCQPHMLPKNYMRSVRKRAGLTQRDMSYLLTYQPGSLSELESGRRTPLLRIALAYQVIFGITPDKLVPRKCSEVERAVRIRAGMLASSLEKRGASTPAAAHRIGLLRKLEKGHALNLPLKHGRRLQ